MASDDPLDQAQQRIEAERRAESALVPHTRDVAQIINGWPDRLLPEGLADLLKIAKPVLVAVAWYLRKTEDGRRQYLVDALVQELQWLKAPVASLDEAHARFLREEFLGLVLDALQNAGRTRSKTRIARMAKVLNASAERGPTMPPDEVEEILRISMDLDDTDLAVLGALVEGQRNRLSSSTGTVPPGQANKYWQSVGRTAELGKPCALAQQIGITDGALHGACAKLQAYGLLIQIERDESKLQRGVLLYTILPRAIEFVDTRPPMDYPVQFRTDLACGSSREPLASIGWTFHSGWQGVFYAAAGPLYTFTPAINSSSHAAFIWSVADLPRGEYQEADCGKATLASSCKGSNSTLSPALGAESSWEKHLTPYTGVWDLLLDFLRDDDIAAEAKGLSHVVDSAI